jgi:zinc/manganese transport system permease protein
MVNTWIAASVVAVVSGVIGFFVVLRGSAFVAHALPQGAFAGAAGAALVGASTLGGLGVFSLLGAVAIGWLGRRGRHDVVTALALVLMLGLGALFLSFSSEYAPEIYSLLFGEVLGVSSGELPAPALAPSRCSTGRCCSRRRCPRRARRGVCAATAWRSPSCSSWPRRPRSRCPSWARS